MRKIYFIIIETLIFAFTNIGKMIKTLLLTVIIIVFCVVLLSIKILFKKNGRFPNTHIEGNPALRKKNIYCAKTEDLLQYEHKNLFERLEQ